LTSSLSAEEGQTELGVLDSSRRRGFGPAALIVLATVRLWALADQHSL
jgi:hypothetical protein